MSVRQPSSVADVKTFDALYTDSFFPMYVCVRQATNAISSMKNNLKLHAQTARDVIYKCLWHQGCWKCVLILSIANCFHLRTAAHT
jgi:hypothetical protein